MISTDTMKKKIRQGILLSHIEEEKVQEENGRNWRKDLTASQSVNCSVPKITSDTNV